MNSTNLPNTIYFLHIIVIGQTLTRTGKFCIDHPGENAIELVSSVVIDPFNVTYNSE